MSLQLPLGPESLNISFQAFGFPEGGVFFLMASANSDNCVKYCRDFRIKEEVRQDKKEKTREGTFLYPVQASWHPAQQFTPILGMQRESKENLKKEGG